MSLAVILCHSRSLAFNNLETLPKDLFRGLEALTKVYVQGFVFKVPLCWFAKVLKYKIQATACEWAALLRPLTSRGAQRKR